MTDFTEVEVPETETELARDVSVSVEVEVEAGDQEAEPEEEEVSITLGETEEAQGEAKSAPIRILRKHAREKEKALKAALRELEELKAAKEAPQEVELGTKPDLWSPEIDGDTDKFEAELLAWNQRKADVEAKHKAKADTEQAQAKAWQTRLETFHQVKESTAKKVPDYDDAIDVFTEKLGQDRAAMIVDTFPPEEAASILYALGKNTAKLDELKDEPPLRFIAKVADLRKEIKVTPRRTAPPPERLITGQSGGSMAVQSELDRLRETAARTGNFGPVVAFRSKHNL